VSNVGYLSKPYESTGLWQVLMGSYTICSGMGTDRQRAPGDGMQLYFMCVGICFLSLALLPKGQQGVHEFAGF